MVPPSSPPPWDVRARGGSAGRDPRDRERGGGDYQGLCANCVYRDTCLLPDSEAGVWHCEKYAENAREAPGEGTVTNGSEG